MAGWDDSPDETPSGPPTSREISQARIRSVKEKLQGKVFFDRFEVIPSDLLGTGASSFVFRGVDLQGQYSDIAIKLETSETDFKQSSNDADILERLGGLQGFPSLFRRGEVDDFSATVMERVGNSLYQEVMVKKSPSDAPNTLAERVVAELGLRALEILKVLHDKSLVHCDMKPENLLISTVDGKEWGPWGKQAKARDEVPPFKLALVDFGLARTFRDETGRHVPYQKRSQARAEKDRLKARQRELEGKGSAPVKKRGWTPLGTCRYVSLGVHAGYIPTRKDDLEGLVYILIELCRGQLPWTGQRAFSTEQGWRRVQQIKRKAWEDSLQAVECLDVDAVIRKAQREHSSVESPKEEKGEREQDWASGWESGWGQPKESNDEWGSKWVAWEEPPAPPLELLKSLSMLRGLRATHEPPYHQIERLLKALRDRWGKPSQPRASSSLWGDKHWRDENRGTGAAGRGNAGMGRLGRGSPWKEAGSGERGRPPRHQARGPRGDAWSDVANQRGSFHKVTGPEVVGLGQNTPTFGVERQSQRGRYAPVSGRGHETFRPDAPNDRPSWRLRGSELGARQWHGRAHGDSGGLIRRDRLDHWESPVHPASTGVNERVPDSFAQRDCRQRQLISNGSGAAERRPRDDYSRRDSRQRQSDRPTERTHGKRPSLDARDDYAQGFRGKWMRAA